MANIDDFKANLIGGGARANQFRVTITEPPGIATGMNLLKTSLLCKSSSLPAQTIGEIPVPFRGRSIYIAGDREFADTWSTVFINDTGFAIRTSIEKWLNGINDLALNTGVPNPADYQSDLYVEQLDRDDTPLKSYIFRSAWPTSTAAIELSHETTNAIEEFEVTWRYQSFEASGVNF